MAPVVPPPAHANANWSRRLNDPKIVDQVIDKLPEIHRRAGRHLSAAFVTYWLSQFADPEWLIKSNEATNPFDPKTAHSTCADKVVPVLVLSDKAIAQILSVERADSVFRRLSQQLISSTEWPLVTTAKPLEYHKELLATAVGSRFGDWGRHVEPTHHLKTDIVQYSAKFLWEPDDIDGSMGRFSLRAYATGKIIKDGGELFAEEVRYGVRIFDTFDFCDDSVEVFGDHKIRLNEPGQPLRLWSLKKGYVTRAADADAALNNGAFRGYRERNHRGFDFVAVSPIMPAGRSVHKRVKLRSV